MAKEPACKLPTQLSAKICFDTIISNSSNGNKKASPLWPKAALLHCYNDNDDNTELIFCWIVDFPEDGQRLYLYNFEGDPQTEALFDDHDIIWLSTPTYFICNHGSFALLEDPNYGMKLQKMDPITHLSVAKQFAHYYQLNSSKLLLCAQKDSKTNKTINLAWVDVSNENLAYIPVWSQYDLSPEQTWNPIPLRAGDQIEFDGTVYKVIHTCEDVFIRESMQTPTKKPKRFHAKNFVS